MNATDAAGHRPVMLDEVMQGLAIQASGCYVDGTYGGGGHTRALLAALGPHGRLLAIDKDPAAVARARAEFGADARVTVRHGSFAQLGEFVDELGLRGRIAGVLLDLGMSSIQLDDAARGFSFMRAGPLDMRMDTSRGPTAAQWLADASEAQIAQVLREFGEERYARRIAAAIVARRAQAPISTTDELVEVVRQAMPRREQHKHFATRTFQALRIVVNHELDDLAAGLEQALAVLAPGGRLVVLSFHSLEDRPVKQFMRQHAGRFEGASAPPALRLVRAPKKAGPAELAVNPRARSAILRVAERLADAEPAHA
ncbi:16S rRNA (cytosine(1402)-N(4))-methyltransferase RsmH [Immundisolibacter sp.]|uniref:16S rRNA (cytosine(1402)-N(4))-methyltransferase RsmH n=1 Tax=Immundisolibacter sp. TaxID=1934948 RepID=UPI00262759E7|nr:16S rRNA (cytosine(1402)-N(4))-methyltransferase RsmH [Immundisolibacter sp.]MDD3650761.1 16S rRNA (cytosine(1402)-N(4))-methyltransferase RsmH [Immundisolibacter sp.]